MTTLDFALMPGQKEALTGTSRNIHQEFRDRNRTSQLDWSMHG